ncbi:hypothetical protein D2N39_04370 [Gemmobacter lutimaris]|uniref:Uncharacterized protein n=1 Tax=Gemmobacter lutimaris TaxID=2306023 RepID=A0A398BWW2_9RHOB|nr:hypothetical protein [Gemmobacter lutimaris]RID92908.1 hypothetical protein D2N39_04370 [Gemmobacter lutimaris]
MRVLGHALIGFVLGALVALGIAVGLTYVMPISQAEGAYAMSVAFFWMPAGAVLGAILAAIRAKGGA